MAVKLTVLAFSLYRTTFYIVDINCPKRLQTLKVLDPVKQKYLPTELCENLAQDYQGSLIGSYKLVLATPKTYIFHFAKEGCRPATSAVEEDFIFSVHTKSLAEVLPHSHPAVTVVHFEWICIPKEVLAAILESGSELGVEDVKRDLEFSSTPQPLYELPVNRLLFDGIKNHVLFADFVIRSQDQSHKLPLCRSFSSREYLSMYHVTKFVQEETVSGAACSIIDHSDGDDSDKDDNDDIVISGSTVELKVSPREAHKWQLLACMEKLSAELALKAVRSKKIFSQIIIYGMLVDSKSGDTEVGKLTMDFLSHESTLTWCRESVGFNECLLKVKNILEN